MSDRVLFLDMDGVIASPRAYIVQDHIADRQLRWIDPIAMSLLNHLCVTHNPLVVVSSAWRHDENFREMFVRAGFKGAFHDDWRTGFVGNFRGDQVREWLSRHPEVAHHIILDDESDFHPDQPLIKCDVYDGLLYFAHHAANQMMSAWTPATGASASTAPLTAGASPDPKETM